MLLMMIEKHMPIDEILCVDTTKEFPGMYEHIKKVRDYINQEITILKIPFDYYFSEHIKTKGKNKGKCGYGFPDFRNRWCTSLKREIIKKQVKGDVIQYHGIAVDEKERTLKNGNNIKYPLVDWGVTEKQALEYCYSKGLYWGGLYEKFKRVSCYCCPLSRIGELRTLYNEFPELWKKLEDMDTTSFRRFRPDYTIEQLAVRFANEQKQAELCVHA